MSSTSTPTARRRSPKIEIRLFVLPVNCSEIKDEKVPINNRETFTLTRSFVVDFDRFPLRWQMRRTENLSADEIRGIMKQVGRSSRVWLVMSFPASASMQGPCSICSSLAVVDALFCGSFIRRLIYFGALHLALKRSLSCRWHRTTRLKKVAYKQRGS